jgi:hypothetical protein
MPRDRVYTDNEATALSESQANITLLSIAYECPFTYVSRACGNWCPHFEFNETQSIKTINSGEDNETNVTTYKQNVCLRCGDGKKKFEYHSDAPLVIPPAT